MKIWLLLMFALPFVGNAQETGIKFEQGLSWKQVLAKAKAENKYVFVDCYATWCGPCREMGKNIYSLNSVGNYFNKHFVSIKVQIDTSKQDNEDTRNWYVNAHLLMTKYNLGSVPSFLFFSADDIIVHRDFSYKTETKFLEMAESALDSNRQYYTLLKKYLIGTKDYSVMKYLAKAALAIHDSITANLIGKDYINSYLIKLKPTDLFTEENIVFISSFMQSSKDTAFPIFYKNLSKIEAVLNKTRFSSGWAENVVAYIIWKENIAPTLENARRNSKAPEWNALQDRISKQYNVNFSNKGIINAKILWYSEHKNWHEVVKYNIQKVQTFGIDTSTAGRAFLNNMIYEVIFKHSQNWSQIKIGLTWMREILNADPKDPAYLDTYANLLYKLGQKKLSLVLEIKAASLAINGTKEDRELVPDMLVCLSKMVTGKPTWPMYSKFH